MKILIVNTYDKGGAANACLRLHEGLLNENVDSKVLLKYKRKGLVNTVQYNLKNKTFISKGGHKFLTLINILFKKRRKKFLKERSKGLEMFSFPESRIDITKSELYKKADLINLHWVSDFIDYKSFFEKNTKPVVWTLHDMNPFTGGEHFEEVYLGIDKLGHPIARAYTLKEQKTAQKYLLLKENVIKNIDNLTIVAPSHWLAREAKNSAVFRSKDVYCIPYGINTNIYKPRDKEYSRALFDVPINKKIILFVSDSIHKERKGFKYLSEALKSIDRDDVMLYAVGESKSNEDHLNNVVYLGEIKDELIMSMIYSMADVFIMPSLMDNLPNTVLESLLCGTPVVGFPVGGVVDMVITGENGILTDEISSSALHLSIIDILNAIAYFDRNKIRENAVAKYDLKVQAKAYLNLFNTILNTKKNKI
ncbi:glycosyltransferase [Winogradskyella wichelsiae]|uniref:glycosyltransferase n=1 Tax=Winogradskyella wichelsiae TaxID=2697007 RepID=UPI003EF131F4